MSTSQQRDANSQIEHTPVLLQEVLASLKPQKNDVCVDCTLGLGGHAKAVLEAIGSKGKLIGIDCDKQALELAKKNLSAYYSQCLFVNDNFRQFSVILKKNAIDQVDRILVDFGVSSLQLDDPSRGFSLRHDAALDMRMNQEQGTSALDVVNTFDEESLAKIFFEYGEERFSRRIAKNIVLQRLNSPIKTTAQLKDIVLRSYPPKARKFKIHPATRTFQAIRIVVNQELEAIEDLLEQFLDHLKMGGRMAVISFHSLEDRLIKHKFRSLAKENKVAIITKKPLRPSEEEIINNPRARSARLRVVERIT